MQEVKESKVEIVPEDTKEKADAVETKASTIPQKSFLERLSDLVKSLKSVEGFSDNAGLLNFEIVIETTDKKDPDDQMRINLEDGLRQIFADFYVANRQALKANKMSFLLQDGHTISFGRSGKAHLPLSEIYHDLADTNPELVDTIEGCIYFVMQHVCPDEDLPVISEICEEFEPQEDKTQTGGFLGLIGNIVGKVTSKLNSSNIKDLEGEDGQVNVNAVGSAVQDLIADSEIRSSMQNMMATVTGEDFDINATMKGLLNMTSK
jgi:hypothetical protein